MKAKFLIWFIAVLSIVTISIADQVFVIKVKGMRCRMCPLAIKKTLKQVKGVEEANVSLGKKLATVRAKDSVKPQELLGAIQKAGKYTGYRYQGTILKVEEIR